MSRRYAPDYVGKLFGVTKQTVIGWCQDGTMPAVNVARASAKRKRWRMSEDDIAVFESRRQNKPEPAASDKRSRHRTIERPVKDFFAAAAAGSARREVSSTLAFATQQPSRPRSKLRSRRTSEVTDGPNPVQ